MEHKEDSLLCQHLLRTRAVSVDELGACAEAQRRAKRTGGPVPRLGELLVARGALDREHVEGAERAARGLTPRRRRRRRGDSSSGRWRAMGGGLEHDGVEIGDRVGDYEVTDRIARGSMGAVFAARAVGSGRRVALKVLAGDRARRDAGPDRFLQEARLATALDHPGLVHGLDFGTSEGRRYFVMEYVPAPSLRSRIKHEGPLGEAEVARVGAEVSDALAFLHERAVVHRDVKPANLLVGASGTKLCDLGLARQTDVPSEATASGATLGTPRYMAPEQARGSRDVGPAADLYSLGVSLFHAAAGRPPFTEDSGVVVLSRHLFDEVPDVRAARPGVSDGLAAVIHRLTRREPERRYASAAEVGAALRDLLGTRAPTGGEAGASRLRPAA